MQPVIEVGLQLFDRSVEIRAECGHDEFLFDGTDEPFHETVGLGPPDGCCPVADVVEPEEKFIGMRIGPAEFTAVVRKHGFYGEPPFPELRDHVVVKHRYGRFGLFGYVQYAEAERTVGVHHAMQVDTPQSA